MRNDSAFYQLFCFFCTINYIVVIVRNNKKIFYFYAVEEALVMFTFSRETNQAQHAKQLLLFIDPVSYTHLTLPTILRV